MSSSLVVCKVGNIFKMWIVPIVLILIMLCLVLGYEIGYQEGYVNGQLDELLKNVKK